MSKLAKFVLTVQHELTARANISPSSQKALHMLQSMYPELEEISLFGMSSTINLEARNNEQAVAKVKEALVKLVHENGGFEYAFLLRLKDEVSRETMCHEEVIVAEFRIFEGKIYTNQTNGYFLEGVKTL